MARFAPLTVSLMLVMILSAPASSASAEQEPVKALVLLGGEFHRYEECSKILADEIALLPSVRVYVLMGDVAIKALNYIAKRSGEPRVIPAGSTYRIRGPAYTFRGVRSLPSYLQAGPAFFIEKSKRKMIAEDIAAALKLTDA